jgi:hypothetical protein
MGCPGAGATGWGGYETGMDVRCRLLGGSPPTTVPAGAASGGGGYCNGC